MFSLFTSKGKIDTIKKVKCMISLLYCFLIFQTCTLFLHLQTSHISADPRIFLFHRECRRQVSLDYNHLWKEISDPTTIPILISSNPSIYNWCHGFSTTSSTTSKTNRSRNKLRKNSIPATFAEASTVTWTARK